jgi:hypothetical protein
MKTKKMIRSTIKRCLQRSPDNWTLQIPIDSFQQQTVQTVEVELGEK